MSKCWCDDTPDKDLWHEDVNGCQTCYECSPSNVSHCIPHDEACEHYVSDALQIEQHDSDLQGVQRNDSRNDSHLPECPVSPAEVAARKNDGHPRALCICDRLRACEQRVKEESARGFAPFLITSPLNHDILCQMSYNAGLDAAREAVATTGGSMWIGKAETLAAIDALRATDQPVTSPAKAKSADLYDPQWGEMIH